MKKASFLDKAHSKKCAECFGIFYRDSRCTWKYWEKAKYCGYACAGKANKKRFDSVRPSMEDKFSKCFRKTKGCWEWTWLKDKDGYGLFPYAGVQYRAAIIALQLDGRKPKNGEYACHKCDNPSCVRPSHLYPGTHSQNTADAVRRGRVARGERHHWSKLNTKKVIDIRSSRKTNKDLAEKYGVAPSLISFVRNRKIWKHIP